jgi:hypothetical protein
MPIMRSSRWLFLVLRQRLLAERGVELQDPRRLERARGGVRAQRPFPDEPGVDRVQAEAVAAAFPVQFVEPDPDVERRVGALRTLELLRRRQADARALLGQALQVLAQGGAVLLLLREAELVRRER